MAAIDPQPYISAATCEFCKIPPGMIWYAVLAGLIDVGNGDPVPTDTNELMEEATCLFQCIPAGYLPYAILAAVSNISGGGGGGSGSTLCGDVAPVAAPTGDCGTYYDRVTGSFYAWNSTTATWVPLIV